jgi:PAS domain S-box-containing protein
VKKYKIPAFIQRVLTPKALIDKPVQLRNARLLSALLTAYILVSLLYSTLHLMADSAFKGTFFWINGTSVILIAGYLLNRKGYFRMAAIFVCGIVSASILFSFLTEVDPSYVRNMFVLVIPVMIAGMLLSLRDTAMLAACNLVAALVVYAVIIPLPLSAVIPPLAFFFAMSLLVIVSKHHRDQEEKVRRTELLEKETRYRSLVENVSEVIFSLDTDGRFTYISPVAERMTRYKVEDFVGEHFARFIHRDDLPRIRADLEKVYAGFVEAGEFRFLDKDDRILYVRTTSQLMTKNGRPVGITGVVANITEQKILETQLLQAQKMESVGRLAGGIAHDFNNLITVIMGYCQILLSDENLDQSVVDIVNSIKTAADRTAALTRQLLAFSRKQVIEPRIVNLNHLVSNMEKMLRRLLGEHIIFEYFPAPGIPKVKVDPAQMEQVVMNLAVNAGDAMPEKGTLTIKTAAVYLDENHSRRYPGIEPGNYVMLSVSDTGCGMDEDTMELIFEPFFTTKERGKGTGLGLSTVYGIVKQSGGLIRCDSQKGKGTTFEVYIPAAEEYAEAEKGNMEGTKPKVMKGAESLMVVEDEEDLREVVTHILRDLGYNVYEAENGVHAFQMCSRMKNEKIDLLVTDIVMPEMNGKELAEKMTKLFPGIKVIFITGYDDNKIVDRDELKEGQFFLTKPFTPRLLGKKIRDILDG